MNEICGYGAPFDYDYINQVNGTYSPNTIHLKDNKMSYYFRKYFLQRAMSLYKWTLPKNWSREYFLYVLYGWGFLAVVNTDKFGIICQGCGIRGYDIYYRPTNAIITNPLLTGILEPRIGKECEIIKFMPNYGSPMDIINYYSDMCALTWQTAQMNIQNSKLSYVFGAKNKTFAESFKKMFDSIQSGQPAVFVDKDLFNDDGSINWQTFTQNLKQNYICGDLLNDLRKWMMGFDNMMGIPCSNTEKKERLLTDEVNSNNAESKTLSELWFDTLQESLEKVREMFGFSIEELNVEKRDFLESETEMMQFPLEVI